ncbi:tRNA (guanine-N(1)-)-methyltransferase [Bordetella trematum]|nr:tRNA (guanine-N(1)-)-methyltransferase [Bordetella trematum]
MRIDVVTLFPEMFAVVRDLGVSGRAHGQGLWSLHTWNPRDFTTDVHRTVDDRPYGGGPGMVMLAAPLEAAVAAAQAARAQQGLAAAPVALMAPVGRRYDQQAAQGLAASQGLILICGRYEGLDQRFIDRCVTLEISLGDFVLSGGEIAALAVIDAAVRLLPGALGMGIRPCRIPFTRRRRACWTAPLHPAGGLRGRAGAGRADEWASCPDRSLAARSIIAIDAGASAGVDRPGARAGVAGSYRRMPAGAGGGARAPAGSACA